MKKSAIILSALSLALLSGTTSAATDDVTPQDNIRFVGAVTAVTCDLEVDVNGSVTNMVQLGTVNKNSTGKDVNFKLKPKADQDPANCDWGTGVGALTQAVIGFAGPLDAEGLKNQLTGSGVATDAYTLITAVNGDKTTALKQGDATRTFTTADLESEGAQFTAKLQGKDEAGLYQSALAFNVYYQ